MDAQTLGHLIQLEMVGLHLCKFSIDESFDNVADYLAAQIGIDRHDMRSTEPPTSPQVPQITSRPD